MNDDGQALRGGWAPSEQEPTKGPAREVERTMGGIYGTLDDRGLIRPRQSRHVQHAEHRPVAGRVAELLPRWSTRVEPHAQRIVVLDNACDGATESGHVR